MLSKISSSKNAAYFVSASMCWSLNMATLKMIAKLLNSYTSLAIQFPKKKSVQNIL